MGFLGSVFGTNTNQGDINNLGNGAPNVAVDPAILAQQQAFAQALQGQMNGTGPSVAGAMLNNANQTNAANTEAMAAGARGINPGLAQRQALQANGQANQSTAANAAVARNQEELNATQAYGQQLATMQNQNMGAQQANQNAALGNKNINAGVAQANTTNQTNVVGGLLKGAGGALAGLAMADGGFVNPGPVNYQGMGHFGPGASPMDFSSDKKSGPKSVAGQNLNGNSMDQSTLAGDSMDAPAVPDAAGAISDLGPAALLAARGGAVPALVSPGERYLPPKEVKKVAEGKKAPMKAGEKIPGKAKVAGAKNSYANDTVPKTLESGGIVLPRSVTQAKDPGAAASAFVKAILAKQGLKR